MIDNVKLIRDPQAWAAGARRIREPLAWAVVGLVAANLILGVVRLVLLLSLDKVPVFAAFQEIGLSLMPLSLVLALVALVCSCLFLTPATPRAYLLTRVSAWVLAIGVGLAVVCMLLGVAASANAFTVVLEIFGGLIDVLIKALAAGSLWVIIRGVGAGRIETAPPAESQGEREAPVTTATEVPTVWKRDAAAGAVWRTADEAAAGSPGAASIGSPGPSQPSPGAAPGVEPAGRWRPVDPETGRGSGRGEGLTKPE